MNRLIAIKKREDIFPEYRKTPVGDLLEYHNLRKPPEDYSDAKLLIGMCMDNRKRLIMPENFAFVIRSGGANLRYSEFKVSFAISIGKVDFIVLIAHTNCGMVNLHSCKEAFIQGLVNRAGWENQAAYDHFTHFSPMFEIGNEIDFVLSEAKRLRLRYPKVTVVPMLYKVEDNLLYLLKED